MNLFKKNPLENERGTTLLEIATVIAILGILSAIAIPQYGVYKSRAYDAMSKSDIYHVYATCRAYWDDNPAGSSCSVPIASSSKYGFVKSIDTVLEIEDGREVNFYATSSHTDSSITYQIGPEGYATIL